MSEVPDNVYEIWVELTGSGRQVRYLRDGIPITFTARVLADKAAERMTRASIHRYYSKLVEPPDRRRVCLDCGHEYRNQDACPLCGGEGKDVVGDPDGSTATTVGDLPGDKAQARANYEAKVARDGPPPQGIPRSPGVEKVLAQAAAERQGPEATRHAAWLASQEDAAGNSGKLIAHMRLQGERGTTYEEAETATGMQWTTAGALIIGYREAGWARQSKEEPTRKTARGHDATVWVLVDEQIPPELREVPKSRRYKEAVEQAYKLMLADQFEEAMDALAGALGKG